MELIATNALIVFVVWMCEHFLKVEPCKLIQYDRIELIKPERKEDLIADLKERTGLEIIKVEVGGIDMLRDMAVLKVYYRNPNKSGTNSVDNKVKLRNSEWQDA